MKYLLVIINISLFLTGCVDTYTVKDFSSPQEFYDRINEKVNDRTVKLVTDSNGVFEADNLIVRRDSTFFTTTTFRQPAEYKKYYNSSDIKNMYQGIDSSGETVNTIILWNGDIISSKNIMIKKDSLFIYDIIPWFSKIKTNVSIATSTAKVNLISYNNRFKGLGEGAGFFALAGILVGIRNADITSGDKEAAPPGLAAIGGAILFGLGGAVLGTVVGSYQDYIVNEQSYNYHGFNSIELVGGLNIAGLSYSANETNFSNDNMIDYSAGMFLLWSLNNELGIKSGIFYNSKGGSFGQYVPSIDFTFHRDVFLNLIDIPVLFQYSFRQADAKPRFYAGPQIGFFLNGKIDNLYDNREFDISYPVYYKTIDSKDVNNPQISFVIGAGLNFQKHITINILYEYGLSKLSNGLFNGETTNIKVNSFSILLGYQLW